MHKLAFVSRVSAEFTARVGPHRSPLALIYLQMPSSLGYLPSYPSLPRWYRILRLAVSASYASTRRLAPEFHGLGRGTLERRVRCRAKPQFSPANSEAKLYLYPRTPGFQDFEAGKLPSCWSANTSSPSFPVTRQRNLRLANSRAKPALFHSLCCGCSQFTLA